MIEDQCLIKSSVLKKFRLERDSNPWGHGFESRSNCEDLSSIWSFIRSSNICSIYLHSFIHPSRVYYELTIWPASSWLDSSVGRALHRHRRGHGFKLEFFQAFFSQLLKLRSNCEDLSSICSIYLHSFNNLRNVGLLTVMSANWITDRGSCGAWGTKRSHFTWHALWKNRNGIIVRLIFPEVTSVRKKT